MSTKRTAVKLIQGLWMYNVHTKIVHEYCLPNSVQCAKYHVYKNILYSIWTLPARVECKLKQFFLTKRYGIFWTFYNTSIHTYSSEVVKVTLKSNGDEALSDEFLLKSNGDEALSDEFLLKSNGDEALNDVFP